MAAFYYTLGIRHMECGANEAPPIGNIQVGVGAPGEDWRLRSGWALPCAVGGLGRKRLISAPCYYGILFS